jgi:hypothetical protein
MGPPPGTLGAGRSDHRDELRRVGGEEAHSASPVVAPTARVSPVPGRPRAARPGDAETGAVKLMALAESAQMCSAKVLSGGRVEAASS